MNGRLRTGPRLGYKKIASMPWVSMSGLRLRIEPTGLAIPIRHRVGLDDTLPRTDGADPPDADPAAQATRLRLRPAPKGRGAHRGYGGQHR
jgi:hypothetical protein